MVIISLQLERIPFDHQITCLFDGVMDMKIREVNENKKQFISLLLLADEQENMIDRYLEKGTMYVLEAMV